MHPKILLKERANIPDTTALLDYKYVQTTLETMYYSITFMIQMKKGATASQCLQITEKVSFNIASEASCVYILSGQKFIKNAKNGPIWRVVEYLKILVKQCYQKGLIELDKNWWKMPKLKYSNATFWVIFKHCDTFFQYILNTVSYSCLKPRSFKITETSIIQ